MGLLDRLEQRASPENPSTPLSSPDAWLWDALGARRSATGVNVNETTAMRASAVYACVRVLAESVASLPLPVFRRRKTRGKDIARDHPLYRLLHDRPNPEMSSFVFRETLQSHVSLWGNAYAEIETNQSGRVLGLWPLRPDVTKPRRLNGTIVFDTKVGNDDVTIAGERVLHIPGLGFDGLVGYSPIGIAKETIGLALATEEFGARFFSNGARPGGVLQHPGQVGAEAAKRLKASWNEVQGGLTNVQRTAILEEGMTFKEIGIPPDHAQFLETRKFQTREIARIFRVPPHLIGDLEQATFSNIEQQSLEFVVHTMRPWLVRWEQTLNYALFSDRDQGGQAFCEFQVEGLLRGDSAQRAAFYTALFNVGALSVNDIRDKENLNPVDGGDRHFVPLNMTALENAGDPPAAKSVATPAANDATKPDAATPQED